MGEIGVAFETSEADPKAMRGAKLPLDERATAAIATGGAERPRTGHSGSSRRRSDERGTCGAIRGTPD
jgi:hypothetical protein